MSTDVLHNLTIRHVANKTTPFLAVAFTLFASCNLSDPVTVQQPPESWCESAEDCSGRGTCDVVNAVGVCLCDTGYRGLQCEECAAGFVMRDGQCEPTTEQPDPDDCAAGEVEIDGACVAEVCEEQCGDGTCTTTGEGTWSCACPDGSTGVACLSCEDQCGNGSCDDDGQCTCDEGWAGRWCDECAAGYGGESCVCESADCITCEAVTATPWRFGERALARHAVIVRAPDEDVLDGVVVPIRFNHPKLIELGGHPIGIDLRMVHTEEIDAVLGSDARWNNDETELWFATQAPIARGGFDVYYLYQTDDRVTRALRSARNVTRQDRGWYHSSDGDPLFATRSVVEIPGSEAMVLQMRQTSVDAVEFNFVSRAQELGQIVLSVGSYSAPISDSQGIGTFNNPYVLRHTLNSAFLIDDITIDFDVDVIGLSSMLGPTNIMLGSRSILTTTSSTSVSAELSRTPVQTGTPIAEVCPLEQP